MKIIHGPSVCSLCDGIRVTASEPKITTFPFREKHQQADAREQFEKHFLINNEAFVAEF